MEPLRIALLLPRRSAAIEGLLADPNRGSVWQIEIAVGADPAPEDLPLLEEKSVPVEIRPIRDEPGFRNLRLREQYDEALADLFTRLRIDYVVLAGYEYIVTDALLGPFAGRVLAIHDADLTLRDEGRLYTGPHAVRDAIFAAEPETRSSVYLVTRDVGRGPLFLIGAPYPLAHMALDARERGDAAFLTHYAELHRQWMVSTSWSGMLSRTLDLLAGGTMKTIGDIVWVDGVPAPCRMGESPAVCHDPEAMVTRGIPRSCPFIG
jgi:hypothetical protein